MEYSLCPNMVVILGFCLGIKEKWWRAEVHKVMKSW
jgi:hypothetical protein